MVRPHLAAFGALTGVAEGMAPVIAGAALSLIAPGKVPSIPAFRAMMVTQFILFAAATFIPSWIVEPDGRAVAT